MTDSVNTKETTEETPAKVVHRRPGRPLKTKPNLPRPRLGVVDKASDESHYVEFLYDKPIIFKKLWQFFKLMAVDKIHMSFMKDSVGIYCVDHLNKSQIQVKIDCNNVNHYFCDKELDIGLSSKNIEIIMGTIDKTYNSILFLSTKDNIQKNIQVVLKNNTDAKEMHKIELIGDYNRISNNANFVDEDYMIKFKLTGKYFKKMISDIKSFSDQITIKKDGPDENLVFEYIKNDKKIKSTHTMENNSAISLRDSLGPDDTFRTSFKVDYVKPISQAYLDETIEIYSDENKPLKFIIQMDEAIKVTILTQIIDYRADVLNV